MANEREALADKPERTAKQREAIANSREEAADKREAHADRRTRALDERQMALDEREARIDELARTIGIDTESRETRDFEALDRARAQIRESGSRINRSEAALERSRARRNRDQTTRVTRNGRPVAVILSPDDLAELEETLTVLSDSQAVADIREADAAYAAGDVLRGVDAVRDLRS